VGVEEEDFLEDVSDIQLLHLMAEDSYQALEALEDETEGAALELALE